MTQETSTKFTEVDIIRILKEHGIDMTGMRIHFTVDGFEKIEGQIKAVGKAMAELDSQISILKSMTGGLLSAKVEPNK